MTVENGGEVGSWGRPYVRFRRKRKFEGKEINEHLEEEARKITQKDKGLLCRSCGHWVPWKRLDIYYNYKSGATTLRMWVCECGAVLKEEAV